MKNGAQHSFLRGVLGAAVLGSLLLGGGSARANVIITCHTPTIDIPPVPMGGACQYMPADMEAFHRQVYSVDPPTANCTVDNPGPYEFLTTGFTVTCSDGLMTQSMACSFVLEDRNPPQIDCGQALVSTCGNVDTSKFPMAWEGCYNVTQSCMVNNDSTYTCTAMVWGRPDFPDSNTATCHGKVHSNNPPGATTTHNVCLAASAQCAPTGKGGGGHDDKGDEEGKDSKGRGHNKGPTWHHVHGMGDDDGHKDKDKDDDDGAKGGGGGKGCAAAALHAFKLSECATLVDGCTGGPLDINQFGQIVRIEFSGSTDAACGLAITGSATAKLPSNAGTYTIFFTVPGPNGEVGAPQSCQVQFAAGGTRPHQGGGGGDDDKKDKDDDKGKADGGKNHGKRILVLRHGRVHRIGDDQKDDEADKDRGGKGGNGGGGSNGPPSCQFPMVTCGACVGTECGRCAAPTCATTGGGGHPGGDDDEKGEKDGKDQKDGDKDHQDGDKDHKDGDKDHKDGGKDHK